MSRIRKTISVVIPARDSQDTIRHTIESLARQTKKADEIIVVIANGDTTANSIKEYIDSGFVKILRADPPKEFVRDAHWKRWIGAKEAKSDIIFFTDSKVILNKQAIENTIKLMNRYKVKAVAGATSAWPNQSNSFLAKLQDNGLIKNNPEFPNVAFLTKQNFGKTESLPVTTALAITKDMFCLIKEDFGVKFSIIASTYDDYVTAWLIVKSGASILLTNKIMAHHRHRLAWKSYVLQISRSGQSAAIMAHQYPECPFSKRRTRQVFGISVLTMLSIVTITTVVSFYGFVLMPKMIILSLLFYFILGVINTVKARDALAFFFPPLTTYLIFTFSLHFMKSYLKRGSLNYKVVYAYLQVH